jgi:hypothetical protein
VNGRAVVHWCGFVALAVAAGVAGESEVSGVVFLDANANGQLDEGERGIGGVPVSDGVSFVRTDGAGRYAIQAVLDPLIHYNKRPILTVSFPSGYWPTAGWFRRLDDEPDPGAVHFGMRPDEQPLPLLFVHGTDCHVPRGGRDLFARFRAEMATLRGRARFCILTGDLVNLADNCPLERAQADYDLFAEQTRDFPLPLFCTAGNHEAVGTRAKEKLQPYHPRFGYSLYWDLVGPLRWSFNAAGYHFAGVGFNWDRDGKWEWGVPPSAAAWLRKDFELAPKDTPILLFVHFPAGAPEFERVVRDFKVRHIFCGHSHEEKTFTFAGVSGWQSGSLSQTSGTLEVGYRLVRITKEGVKTKYTALGYPRRRSATHSPAE